MFQRHTGRSAPTAEAVREAWAIVGRRGGKSRIAALLSVYLAAFKDYSDVLAPGERGLVMALAPDLREGVAKLAALQVDSSRKVLPLRGTIGGSEWLKPYGPCRT